jgi:replication factor C large subunit
LTEWVPWTYYYRPKNKKDILGNNDSIEKLEKWMKNWVKKPPRKKAAFIHGPPGTGKTSAVHILAKENGFDLFEVNASDTRTKKLLEIRIGRALNQNVTIFGKKRMILFDEMEGISGQKDRGGIQSILAMIKNTNIPIILIATTIKENMENKFRSLVRKSLVIEFNPILFSTILEKLELITKDQGIKKEGEILELIALRSQGDLRSAINDLETIAQGKSIVNNKDIEWMGKRNKQDFTPNLIYKLFNSRSLWEARQIFNQSMIPYDDLFDWIYENIPLILDDPQERVQAMESLSNADVFSKRARTSNYRLLKYMFNSMTGGVSLHKKKSKGLGLLKQIEVTINKNGLQNRNFSTIETKNGIKIKPNNWLGREKWGNLNQTLQNIGAKWIYGQNVWIVPYVREPLNKWRYIRTYHNRRKRRNLAGKLAKKTHTSTQEAITETIPLLKIIYKSNPNSQKEIDKWLKLEESEKEFLIE